MARGRGEPWGSLGFPAFPVSVGGGGSLHSLRAAVFVILDSVVQGAAVGATTNPSSVFDTQDGSHS